MLARKGTILYSKIYVNHLPFDPTTIYPSSVAMSLTIFPSEILSEILHYLDNEVYELLYATGCSNLNHKMRRSVKRIDSVKYIHPGFTEVEYVNYMNHGKYFSLFPKIRSVGIYPLTTYADILLIPSTITSIKIMHVFTADTMDMLPTSITNLDIYMFMFDKIDEDYTLREGYVNVNITTIVGGSPYNILIFPASATSVGYSTNNCGVELSLDVEILNCPTLIDRDFKKLRKLTCKELYYYQELPSTIESLSVSNFRCDGSNLYLHPYYTNVLTNYHNVISLPNLIELSMNMPHTLINLLPKTIKILSVRLAYSPLVRDWETNMDISSTNIFDLCIDHGIIDSIILPSTITRLSCRSMYVDGISCDLPNLKYLTVDFNSTRVTTYDFKKHGQLIELHTRRTVLLSNIPTSLRHLSCNSVLYESSTCPSYLVSLRMNVGYNHYTNYLKSIMRHCTIEVDRVLESPEKRLSDMFKNNPCELDRENVIMKIYWCDMTGDDVISIISSSRITKKRINYIISTYVRNSEIPKRI